MTHLQDNDVDRRRFHRERTLVRINRGTAGGKTGTNQLKRQNFCAKVWLYRGKGAWHFVTLPEPLSKRIKFLTVDRRNAWGSLRVTATIGKTSWKTSLFPSAAAGAYLLPLKAEVREREKCGVGAVVTVSLAIDALR